ncbi:hypothetical protein PTKIN_Ptkin16aG0523400 [Pterospermum kingtungense]
MADVVSALERISDLLIHEAVFLGGVREEVERLRAELDRMNSVLKDADYQLQQTQIVRTLVRQIREIAYEAEDVIDSFILHQVSHHGGFRGIINKFTSIFTKPSHLHKTGMKIQAIQTRLEDISKSLPAYGHISGGQSSHSGTMMLQQRFRKTYSHVEEEDVVSLKGMTRKVLARLMTEEEDRPHVVVSIVGMGGIGKTTLAKRVYNHLDVKRHFDCSFWAFISQDCKPTEVFYDFLIKLLSPSKEEREEIDKLKEDELIKRVFDVLKRKRYLVILDDIWREEDWNRLKPAFPRGEKGSKILLTTRNKDVALSANPCNSPIELPFLTDADSWRLFKKKAFPENTTESEARSREFEMLGREMVNKCGGLPLAIVTLGGLLATKSSRAEWEMVQRNIHSHLNKDQQQDRQYGAVNGILVLSYNDLPYYLKPCFLYVGHYPEDWEISKKELIQLWIAEGFISPSSESEGMLEDAAEGFLEELINRCLVQVGQRDHTGKGPVNAMLKLAELCTISGLKVSFLNSEYNHNRLVSFANVSRFKKYPGFEFRTIPNGLPGDHPRSGGIFMEIFEAMNFITKPLLKNMLVEMTPPVDCVIGDGILGFVLDAANELGIPIINCCTIGACYLWSNYSIPDMIEAGELPIKGSEDMDRPITTLAGMEKFLRCRDLPSFCRASNMSDSTLLRYGTVTRKSLTAYGLILNTFEELEGPILSQIREKCPNIYTIGPLNEHFKIRLSLENEVLSQSLNCFWEVDRSCMSWLDKQPNQSIVYVSFGSIAVMSAEQIMEFWHGLVNSKKRFLWVVRPNSVAGEGFPGDDHTPVELVEGTKERGYIVEWAPQEEVLGHQAVGGFLTHSGWNSTMESIVAGVPMLCWPYFAD